MFKTLTGGTTINYGATLPTDQTTFDGTLFLKTGDDAGLYVFRFTQDGDATLLGDQSAQGWSRVVTPGLYVEANGSVPMTGDLRMSSPALRIYSNNLSAVDANPMTFSGDGPFVWKKASVSNEMMRLTDAGLQVSLAGAWYTVWHAGNDGVNSGLDADMLDGQSSDYFRNASNINAGTLNVSRLPFTPIQQGGGTGQQGNKIHIGWSGDKLFLQVDASDFGKVWPIDVNGNAATASYANSAGAVAWTNVSGRPTNLSEFTNGPGYLTTVAWTQVTGRPTAVSAFTNDAGYLSTVAWTQVTGRPTNVSSFTNDAGYLSSVSWTQVSGRPTSLSSFTNDPKYITGSNTALTGTTTAERIVVNGGSAAYPALTFVESANDTGFYSGGDGHINFASNAQYVGQIQPGGHLYMTGNVTAYSDERLKDNIEVIPDALSKVLTIRGVTFTRKSNGERGTGVIAQDVQKVLPEAVMTDSMNMIGVDTLSVAYGNMVGLLIESIKELNAKVDSLQAELEALKGAKG